MCSDASRMPTGICTGWHLGPALERPGYRLMRAWTYEACLARPVASELSALREHSAGATADERCLPCWRVPSLALPAPSCMNQSEHAEAHHTVRSYRGPASVPQDVAGSGRRPSPLLAV